MGKIKRYFKEGETFRDKPFFPSNKNGMPIPEFLSLYRNNKELKGKDCLYLITVYLKAYGRYSKVGLCTDIGTRMSFYRTSWWPIIDHARIHGLWLKKGNNTRKAEAGGAKKPATVVYRAEQRVHDEVLAHGFEMMGEWARVSVNQMVKWLNLFHFGSLTADPQEKADGHGMAVFLFTDTHEMIRVDDEFVNADELAENVVGTRVRKKSKRQLESEGQPEEKEDEPAEEKEDEPPEEPAPLPAKRQRVRSKKQKEADEARQLESSAAVRG